MPGGQVQVIQHVECEGPGRIGSALSRLGIELRVARVDRALPAMADLEGVRGLVVMGGPMGVYEAERFPHLREEQRLIESALAREIPVLGICLGSQLLAAALGARVVFSGTREIGWMPVELKAEARDDALFGSAERSFEALHWHGDVFDLPAGAVSLARSALTEHQAFRHGARTYGLLFHLEIDAVQLQAMANAFAAELAGAGVDSKALLAEAVARDAAAEKLARNVFGAWGKLIA
jgi:GMP synthase (glutamine-hydrolysing)